MSSTSAPLTLLSLAVLIFLGTLVGYSKMMLLISVAATATLVLGGSAYKLGPITNLPIENKKISPDGFQRS